MSQMTIAAIILVATFVSFFHPKVPNVVVALGAAIAFGLTGIVDPGTLFNNFTSATCILMIGMMIIGGAMFQTGLGGWIGNRLIKLTGTKTGRIQFAVYTVTFVLASVLTGTAALMIMYPLMCSIALSSKKSMSEIVMYQMAGSIGGSWLTFAGAGMIGTSAGVLEAAGFRPWSFFEIAWYGLPRFLLTIPLLIFFMNKYVIRDCKFKAPDEDIAKKSDELANKLTPKMILTFVILVLTITGFVATPTWLPIHLCAALGGFAVLLFGCITPKQALYGAVSWETIFLIGGMGVFARGMQSSGFGQLIADSILNITGASASPILLVFILMMVTAVITQFMSDNAAVGMTAPIGIMLAMTQGIEPYAYVMACLVGCSAGHLSVMASPSLAFSMNIGGYEPKHFFRFATYIEFPAAISAGMIMIPLIWL